MDINARGALQSSTFKGSSGSWFHLPHLKGRHIAAQKARTFDDKMM